MLIAPSLAEEVGQLQREWRQSEAGRTAPVAATLAEPMATPKCWADLEKVLTSVCLRVLVHRWCYADFSPVACDCSIGPVELLVEPFPLERSRNFSLGCRSIKRLRRQRMILWYCSFFRNKVCLRTLDLSHRQQRMDGHS